MAGEDEYDMVVKNPNKGGEAALREQKEILEEMGRLDVASGEIMDSILSKYRKNNYDRYY